jgi:hypothetical protein
MCNSVPPGIALVVGIEDKIDSTGAADLASFRGYLFPPTRFIRIYHILGTYIEPCPVN